MVKVKLFSYIERVYLKVDKRLIRRTCNLRLIPGIINRRGGKVSYGEWCHVIGIFQTLLFYHLNKKNDNFILDIGCGTGLIGIASEPFLGNSGMYIGIDVIEKDIEFCKKHYPQRNFLFKHIDVFNPTYAPAYDHNRKKWDIADESIDMVTALSVWTHLNEEDAIFYFREIDRVLKPSNKAIITFFILDGTYYNTLKDRSNNKKGKYHNTKQGLWIFNKPCSKSRHWFHPKWVKNPEDAIAVTASGINSLLEKTRLKLVKTYTGNWKETPGVFFQDILVFEKEG